MDPSLRIFINLTLKIREVKTKINKWDYIKLKGCTTKETVDKRKSQPTKWEKIFANNNTSDKGLTFKISKEVIQLKKRNPNNLNRKMDRGSEEILLPRRYTNNQQTSKKILNFSSY